MNKVVVIFGLIAGAIVSIMLLGVYQDGKVNFDNGWITGTVIMVIAFSTIFFAVRSYREKHRNGSINFSTAFLIGLYITLIASTMYVATWMIIYETVATDFTDQYAAHMLNQMEESGASEAEIQSMVKEMEGFNEMYRNPIMRIGITYTEILPVGLLISLISAAILRKKEFSPS